MIDPHDTVTMTVPGVPPLPPKEPRKTQAIRREELGFQGPRTRPGCQHCTYCRFEALEVDTPFERERERLRCDIGDFPVQRGAVCDHFAAAG